jgi:putative ABC transport system permease protein
VDVYFFRAQRFDVAVSLDEARHRRALENLRAMPGVLRAEPFRAVAVKVRAGHRERRLGIIGVVPGAHLSQLLDAELRPVAVPAQGLVLSGKLARVLGVGRGDRVTVEAVEGRRPVAELPVSAVVEEYIGIGAYMAITALNRFMGEGPSVSGARLLVDANVAPRLYRELKETPAVASVVLRSAALESFDKTLAETLWIMVTFYVSLASVIAFGVVYNAARISLSQRGRELASLRVLGFTRYEVSYILLAELAFLTFAAVPLGWLIGYGMAWLMVMFLDTELYRIPLVIERDTYGFAAVVVAASAVVSGLIVRRRIDRLDLVAVLKTRE